MVLSYSSYLSGEVQSFRFGKAAVRISLFRHSRERENRNDREKRMPTENLSID
ncbi:MAG: hypothetical protein O9276_05495 [Microcystis sp. LE17-20A]|nr:hypothetical protein [Microcystis sp. LE17-20A]MDJ0526193.1 hypothetical protein [Microcystis sp. M53600_WE12]